MQSLSSLSCAILMRSLPKIEELTNQGVLKIKRNIVALQQCFSNISGTKEEKFDRVRRFYQMIGDNHSKKSLMSLLNQQFSGTPKDFFTEEEWTDALEFVSPDRKLTQEQCDGIHRKFF